MPRHVMHPEDAILGQMLIDQLTILYLPIYISQKAISPDCAQRIDRSPETLLNPHGLGHSKT